MHLLAVLPSEIIDFKNIPQFYYASPRRTPLRNHWLEEHTPILIDASPEIIDFKNILPSEIIDLKNIYPLRIEEHTPIMHLHAVLPSKHHSTMNIHAVLPSEIRF